MKNACELIREYGITIDEAVDAISRFPKIPFTEMDIIMIQNNQNLSMFQKCKLIKKITYFRR